MFTQLDLTSLASSPTFAYAAGLPFFAGRGHVAFQPGLNILFGPNGCGKTTVLQMLARRLCAAETGLSTVSIETIQANLAMTPLVQASPAAARPKGASKARRFADQLGVAVAHDGQPVIHCDPHRKAALLASDATDGFVQGLRQRRLDSRRSHGQAAFARMDLALSVLFGQTPFPQAVARSIDAAGVNPTWRAAIAQLEADLQGTIPRGQPSILLDEPEASISLQVQCRLWRKLASPKTTEAYQVIVATHSPFALGIAHANYIDFEPEFRPAVEALLRERFGAAAA